MHYPNILEAPPWFCFRLGDNRSGKPVGVLDGPAPDKDRHFDPHLIAVDKDGSIFTAEVMPWRAQKFRPK
jgi:hypothetical protein